ncbi:MAG: hypothetical protein ACI30I_00385, partial [Parabacteroides sp.]
MKIQGFTKTKYSQRKFNEFRTKQVVCPNMRCTLTHGFLWKNTIGSEAPNIFKEGELNEKVVCRKFRHTTQITSLIILPYSKSVVEMNKGSSDISSDSFLKRKTAEQ